MKLLSKDKESFVVAKHKKKQPTIFLSFVGAGNCFLYYLVQYLLVKLVNNLIAMSFCPFCLRYILWVSNSPMTFFFIMPSQNVQVSLSDSKYKFSFISIFFKTSYLLACSVYGIHNMLL